MFMILATACGGVSATSTPTSTVAPIVTPAEATTTGPAETSVPPPGGPAVTLVPVVPAEATPDPLLLDLTQVEVPPSLSRLIPDEASPGEDVEIEGIGGLIKLVTEDGGVAGHIESAKSFTLFFDGEPIGSIVCFIGRCEGTLTVPNDAQPGSHQISVEGGSSRSLTVVEASAVQDVVTPEVAEQDDEGVFLRVIAPLDEARGYCLDIPGHMAGVRLESPLQVHTCKHGIWNQDGRFDVVALGNGVLRMPHYDLCLQAANTSIGARLLLSECTGAELQTWKLQDSGEIALGAIPQMCISVEDGPGRDAGGPQYVMRGVGIDTCTEHASDRQQWTVVTPR